MKEERKKELEKMSLQELRKKQITLLMQILAKHKKIKEEERKKKEQENRQD